MKDKRLIIIVGPTGSGKTDVSLKLASLTNGEIISADSMQVYRYLNIGTDKLPYSIRREIPHHLISIKNPDENFSAGEFKQDAEKIIKRLLERGKQPIVVGGTGLYIKALVDGIFPSPSSDKRLREKLHKQAKRYGRSYLWKRLKRVDPVAIDKIHPNNLSRIIRALEVYIQTKIPFSQWQGKASPTEYSFQIFGIRWPRDILYKRINQRVEDMFRKGLVKETRRLISNGFANSRAVLSGLGYRQIIGALRGEYSLERAKELTKRDSRRYAKRQMTWWRNERRITWIDIESDKNISNVVREIQRLARVKKA